MGPQCKPRSDCTHTGVPSQGGKRLRGKQSSAHQTPEINAGFIHQPGTDKKMHSPMEQNSPRAADVGYSPPRHRTPEQASPTDGEALPLIWLRLSAALLSFIHTHWRIVLLFDKKPHSHALNAARGRPGALLFILPPGCANLHHPDGTETVLLAGNFLADPGLGGRQEDFCCMNNEFYNREEASRPPGFALPHGKRRVGQQ